MNDCKITTWSDIPEDLTVSLFKGSFLTGYCHHPVCIGIGKPCRHPFTVLETEFPACLDHMALTSGVQTDVLAYFSVCQILLNTLNERLRESSCKVQHLVYCCEERSKWLLNVIYALGTAEIIQKCNILGLVN